MGHLCIVCKSCPRNVQSFWFPHSITKCQEWLTALGLDLPPECVRRKKKVCAKHFSHASFRNILRNSLNRNAIPSITGVENELEKFTGCTPEQPALQNPCTSSEATVHPESLPTCSTSVSKPRILRLLPKEQSQVLSKVPLSPKKTVPDSALKIKHRHLKRLKTIVKAKQQYFEELCHMDTNPIVHNVFKGYMKPSASVFLLSQIRLANRKPKARRWTLDEKLLALSLYKRSPKAYFLLSSFTALPSRSILLSLLSKVPLSTGVNESVVQHLQDYVKRMPEQDRICVLMFDEMSIRQHIQYDPASDCISGYEDYGNKRCNSYANAALVFMLQGLRRSWKQPIAYFFVNSKIPSLKLADCITEVLDAVHATGLVVLATVCDIGTNNVKALQLLGASFESPSFQHKSQQIFTVYDPPHLLKCTRNLFLKYPVDFPMQFADEEVVGRADIRVIKDAFEMDKNETYFRFVPKLTSQHLNPDAFEKMRVKLAAQLFSHSVACLIFYNISKDVLGPNALSTATFVEDVDRLFDSFNGTELSTEGKDLRTAVSTTSSHLQFWETMKNKISQWRFVGYGAKTMPLLQKGWLANIIAMTEMWKKCKAMELNNLRTRSVNRDALENMFGGLRSYCADNCNPTSLQFISCLKTHIVNGLTNFGVRGTNCENDFNELLSNLRTFIQKRTVCGSVRTTESNKVTNSNTLDSIIEDVGSSLDDNIFNDASADVYVSGFIARHLLKKLHCELCKTALTSHPDQWTTNFITFKEYSDNDNHLTYPSQELVNTVALSADIIECMLPDICHSAQVGKQLVKQIFQSVDFSWIDCTAHNSFLKEGIVKSVCRICIPWYCTRINRTFKSLSRASCKVAIVQHE